MPDAPLTRLVDGRLVPQAGSWQVDGMHSSVAFTVRHLLTRLRGRFTDIEGAIDIADRPAESSVAVTIDSASVTTGHAPLDDAIRGNKLLDVEHHPAITFASTSVEPTESGTWLVTGDLDIRGICRSVTLATTFLGAATSPFGHQKMSFVATASIDRRDFGIDDYQLESPDSPGVYLLGLGVDVTLDIEADWPSGSER